MSGWRHTLALDGKRAPATMTREPITMKELQTRPLDLSGTDFQGIGKLQDLLFDKAMLTAMGKHKRVVDIANVMKIPISRVSVERRRLAAKEEAKL